MMDKFSCHQANDHEHVLSTYTDTNFDKKRAMVMSKLDDKETGTINERYKKG